MIHVLKNTALKVSALPLPFEEENKTHIDVFWEQAFEVNPRLWNGPFYMFTDVCIDDGVLIATAHRTDFATFMYWRENDRPRSVTHITGTSLPVLIDGSLLAVQMAKHTANAGRIYFPAGSFDHADIVQGYLDPVTNFAREMEEEIGIALKPGWLAGPIIAAEHNNSFHVTRKLHLPMSFEKVEKNWQKFRALGGDDEISSLVQFTSAMHLPTTMPTYAVEFCQHHFSRGELLL